MKDPLDLDYYGGWQEAPDDEFLTEDEE